MYILQSWGNYCDQKVKNKLLFFFLVFAGTEGKRTRVKVQKQTIYFKQPYMATNERINISKKIFPELLNSPAAHGGRPMPMGWVY